MLKTKEFGVKFQRFPNRWCDYQVCLTVKLIPSMVWFRFLRITYESGLCGTLKIFEHVQVGRKSILLVLIPQGSVTFMCRPIR